MDQGGERQGHREGIVTTPGIVLNEVVAGSNTTVPSRLPLRDSSHPAYTTLHVANPDTTRLLLVSKRDHIEGDPGGSSGHQWTVNCVVAKRRSARRNPARPLTWPNPSLLRPLDPCALVRTLL